jgi:polysaccharide deacetylase family protein (PEP-CTERM system associated)
MLNVMSVDLEEWFHGLDLPRDRWPSLERRVEANTGQLLEILAAHEVKATFFVLGDIVGRVPHLIRAIDESGHQVGCHGLLHRRYTTLSDEEIRADIDQSIEAVGNVIGRVPDAYRAPCFSLSPQNMSMLDHLAHRGVKYDSSMFPIKIDRYGIRDAPCAPHLRHTPSGTIWEFPITPAHFAGLRIPFAGGAYFRLFPFALITRLFRNAVRANKIVTFYIHTWELDADQPRIPVARRLAFTHYYGLGTFRQKLEKLLSLYRFGTIEQCIRSMDPVTAE